VKERGASIWWLHPAAPFAIAVPLIGLAAGAIPESSYRTLWRTPKFFDSYAMTISLACSAVFVLGAVMSSRLTTRANGARPEAGTDAIPDRALAILFQLSFYLCVLGYLLWAGLAISRGITLDTVMGVASGEKGAMYDARFTYLPTVGGITTLTQFGTAAMIVGAVLGARKGWSQVRFKLLMIVGIAAVRALVNSERFALIELAAPFAITRLGMQYLGSQKFRASTRRLVALAPILALILLLMFFTGFEYFRSWTNYYSGRDMNLLEFGSTRLAGYYVTSFNNGGYLLSHLEPLNAPYFTLHFLWGFPLTSPIIERLFPNPLLQTTEKWFYFPFLESDANLEFNNADGVLFPLMDYGIPGGLIYWFFIGILCGWLYEKFQRKQLVGLLLYPATFLGLIEAPLALYWGEGRAFPPFCLLAAAPVILWFARRVWPATAYRPAPHQLLWLKSH
jgi:oligosaccharide repeat unit polymerase